MSRAVGVDVGARSLASCLAEAFLGVVAQISWSAVSRLFALFGSVPSGRALVSTVGSVTSPRGGGPMVDDHAEIQALAVPDAASESLGCGSVPIRSQAELDRFGR